MSEDEINARANEKARKRKAAREKMLASKTREKGLLIVHTGKGKGKSTAAFGLVFRALGNGMRVGDEKAWRRDGLLENVAFRTGHDGADIWRYSCRTCHQDDGYNPVKQAFDHTDPEFIEGALDLVSVSRSLERVADHATNIAEDVIYMVEGAIVRHTGGEEDRDAG